MCGGKRLHQRLISCNTLQHTTTHCNTLQDVRWQKTLSKTYQLQHTATHYNTLQHTAGCAVAKDFIKDSSDPLFLGCNVEVQTSPGLWIPARSATCAHSHTCARTHTRTSTSHTHTHTQLSLVRQRSCPSPFPAPLCMRLVSRL